MSVHVCVIVGPSGAGKTTLLNILGGMDSLSDVQVLEVALYYAIARRDTNEIAHALLRRFGSLSGVLEAPRAELLKIDGVGDVNEVSRRIFDALDR